MQTCEYCKITTKGENSICPLCGGILKGQGDLEDEVFPHIPTIYQEFNIFIRVLILISIVAIAVSFSINAIFTKDSRWSLLVAAAILCMWVSLFFIIRKKNNIPKTIVWQVVLISVLSVLWDRSMGWHGWSIDYVIPSMCVIAMIVMAIGGKLLKIGARDMIVYLLVDVVFGFIPAIFILLGVLNVLYPSIICVAASAISLSALILFQGDNIRTELNKRMHI
ncbi:hypothetical protein I5677_04125 [Mobilitalea sibirica]|uniref:Uncharacterized protein n=1 Tax=Mobilitalea sibirica TaxID=1462919 RepID=A0A8J7H1A3_9FIRM|nr:hypothetical protein [Mobilitalea sibirica]